MKTRSIGILGVGAFLPEDVRTNDWWPADFRQAFAQRAKTDVLTPEVFLDRAETAPQRILLEQILQTYDDPFRGSEERRIAPPEMTAAAMESAACKQALDRAGIRPDQVGLILSFSMPGDHFCPTNAGAIQARVGASRAYAISIDTGCSSFLTGVALAEAMILAGQCRYALVVCSAIFSRLADWADPSSVNFGDGAAAAVVGGVGAGEGFLTHAAETVGELNDGVSVGPKSSDPFYSGAGGPFYLHSKNVAHGREIVMKSADYALKALQQSTRQAEIAPHDITHFFAHQPTIHFNAGCRLGAGLSHTQTTDTFKRFASVAAANIPINLFYAQESGQLKRGDLAFLYACGAGFHWTSSLVRWSV